MVERCARLPHLGQDGRVLEEQSVGVELAVGRPAALRPAALSAPKCRQTFSRLIELTSKVAARGLEL